MARLLPWLIWLSASLGFVAWSASRTFHIGQMVLPRAQAIAIAISIVTVFSLVLGWLWLIGWSLGKWLGWIRSASLLDLRWLRMALLISLGLVPLLLLYGRWVEPRWVAVRELKLGKLGEGEQPLRVAVISDLHTESWRQPWSGLAEKVNALRPHLVLFLGDALNRGSGLDSFRRALREISAPHKLAVRGNWDVWYWRSLPLLEGTGFEWLDGERRSLQIRGQRIHLVGLPYAHGESGRQGELLLSSAAPGWRLFLYHTPDLIERVPSADLYLAGHTHGGQISIPFFGALVTLSRYGKRFERGLHQVGQTRLYVHPGLGVEPIIPLRLGVRPEILLVELGHKR